MNQTTSPLSPDQAEALEYAWGEYRVWAATARKKKGKITSWKFRVLALTILGAILGTVSSQVAGLKEEQALALLGTIFGAGSGNIAGLQANLAWVIGAMGSICLAVAAYFGQEILKPEEERIWVRARSTAEALKAETFLFRTGTPPYDTLGTAGILVERVQKLLEQVKDLPSANLSQEQKRERLPDKPLGMDQYLEERLQDQVELYYLPMARRYEAILRRGRLVTFIVGGLAAVLGVLGKYTAAWVAVLTTLGTSVAAYLFANRYQYLLISYQATARQLEYLKRQWQAAGAPKEDLEKQHRLILDCEEAISIENNAWMAKLLEKREES